MCLTIDILKNFYIIAKKTLLCQLNMYYAIVNIMEGIKEEIQILQNQLDEIYRQFRNQAYELGLVTYDDRESLKLLIGNSLLENFKTKREMQKIKEEEVRSLLEIESSIKEGKQKKKMAETELSALNSEKKILLSRLGSIAFVQAEAGVANDRITRLLSGRLEKENRAAKLSHSKFPPCLFIGKIKLSILRKSHVRDMLNVGILLDKEDLLKELTGVSVEDLLSKLDKIKEDIIRYEGELEKSSQAIVENKDDKIKSSNYKAELEEVNRAVEETAISYGIYLFENGSKWIDAATPERELDIISKMLILKKKEDSLIKEIEDKKKGYRIDELSLLISHDKKNIELLVSEKEKIDEEIEKLNVHIRTIETQIKGLRKG